MKWLRKIYQDWQAEKQRQHEINIKLEALTDPTFLDRAVGVSNV